VDSRYEGTISRGHVRANSMCLYTHLEHGRLVPTFQNPRGGDVVHQIDHLYVTVPLSNELVACEVGSQERVFGQQMSDHLPIIAEFRDTDE
jgi:hypothetical protein